MPGALFISDLHLSGERPAVNERFFRLLRDAAARYPAVYILGDLFDYWVGDDELDPAAGEPLARAVCEALAATADRGVAVHVMHGNRDFLIGERFLAASGARALPDPSVILLGGSRTLLLHGDTLCSADAEYQHFRAQVRTAGWQRTFLAQPLAQRRARALELRAASERDKRAKPPEIMDVCEADVVEAFRRHGADQMIHGHTHRAGRHALEVDGRRCLRWVLPDWYERGGYLAAEDAGLRLELFAPSG